MPVRRHRHEPITRINSKVGRDINRSIILDAIRRRQPISRAEISELTQLNKSTVSHIVSDLLEEDLLAESPDRSGGVGRNRVNLSIMQGRHYVGAIAFDAPCTRVAIVDINGTLKAREEIRTKMVAPEQLVAQSIARLQSLQDMIGPHHFHGLGISVAGIMDSSQSKVIHAANLGWNNVDLAAVIRAQFPDLEIASVENDAKSAAMAELLLGKHNLAGADLVYLLLGAGIGAGIAVNGRILHGHTHAAGEVGHMTLVDGGEQCQCGNAGCFEIYASERAPVRWFENAKHLAANTASPRTLSDVVDAARSSDPDALHAIHTWAEHIGVGIGDMIAILDPQVVVLGGAITQIWDLVYTTINEAAHGRGTFARERSAAILPTSLTDHPPLLGAAALAIRRIFADYRMMV